MELFRQLAPQFSASPDPIPACLLTLLSGEAQFYLGMALSQNTKKCYSHEMRQFYSFCSQSGLAPTFPINEDILVNFSVCMARSVQQSTIKNYLSAIKHYYSSHGYHLNLSAFLRLQFILRGIKRSQGDNYKTWRPITLHMLNIFYHLLNVKYTSNKDCLTVWKAMTFAFFGFFRIGELTCDSPLNSERQLTFSDVVFMPKSSPKYMLVRLKVSNTNHFRKGQTIVIGKASSHLCPLSAMLAYLESRTPFPTTGPLFPFQSGSFLTRGRLTNETGFYFQREGLIQAYLPVTVFSSVQLPQLRRLTHPLGSLRF